MRRLRTSATRMTRTSRAASAESVVVGLIRGSSGVEGRDGESLIARRARSSVKLLARTLVPAPAQQRRVVLIFGCQRSGTTMLQQTLLDRSWRVFILEEHDRRLIGDDPNPEETAWEEDSVVFGRIRRLPFEVVAVKPLVESDRATELIDTAGNARAIWMLRHYLDVARSNLRRFGLENAHRDLEAFRSPDLSNWRCRGATDATRRAVVELLQEGLEPLDAAALFWWVRNQLYFDQGLDRHDGIRVLRYERVRTAPQDVIRSLSKYIDISLPVHSTTRRVRAPRSPGPSTDLHPKVGALCDEMWKSFDGCREL
jgi:hypothetical protein